MHARLPIFQHSKMFRLQHQFNNIVETTQLNNDQMPEFHCHCEFRSVHHQLQQQHQPQVALFEKSFTALSIGPCGRLPQIIWSASLRVWLSFLALFYACSKPPTLHPIRDSPLGLYSTNLEAIGLLWWYLDSWPAASSVHCAALRAVLTRPARCPAGRWIW